MWNASLPPISRSSPLVPRIRYGLCEYKPDIVEENQGPPEQMAGENQSAYELRKNQWIRETTPFILPEPGEFSPNPLPALDLKTEFNPLQIIVKLANIELTPDKPEYRGGSWHVEGQLVRLHFPRTCLLLTRLCRMSVFAPQLYITTHAQT